MALPPNLHLGTSGWSYKDWAGPFYPRGTKPRDYLETYATHFNSVELDSSFYGVPRTDYVKRWREVTPEKFVFSAKFPKAITHEKVLRDCEREVAEFLRVMDLLDEKLGVLLLQFEYGFKPDQFEALDTFLASLPDGYRFAVEVRNRKWLEDRFFEMLRQHGVALTLVDHPWVPKLRELTADFTYIRWLGDRKKVEEPFDLVRVDRSSDVRLWTEVIRDFIVQDVTTFGYVNNHYSGHSPETAKAIVAEVLSLTG